jgi:hypothetical protein
MMKKHNESENRSLKNDFPIEEVWNLARSGCKKSRERKGGGGILMQK